MPSTGKIAEVLFENVLEEYDHQTSLLGMVDNFKPDSGTFQNADNAIWRPVQQHAPVIEGFDLTGQEQDIIEETYPAILGVPTNDFVQQRVDQLRDMSFWAKRGKQSGKRQATELNKRIANLVAATGSLFVRSNATSGYPFIGEAQALLNERQVSSDDRYFLMNDRDTLKFASDLAARQTLQGRPESDAWSKGQIGANVAEFDVFTGSYLPTVLGGAAATTIDGLQSFKPEGGSVDATSTIVTNVDYRLATITVASSAAFAVGDKFTIAGVNAVGLADKTDTGQLMTFTVVSKPSGTTMNIFPKPINIDDGALTTTEKAYGNVKGAVADTVAVDRLNIGASEKANIFWAKDSIEVVGGDVPMELMSEFDGMKVISETLANGQRMYMVYDGNIATLNLRFRIFTWYGLTNKNPMANGLALSF